MKNPYNKSFPDWTPPVWSKDLINIIRQDAPKICVYEYGTTTKLHAEYHIHQSPQCFTRSCTITPIWWAPYEPLASCNAHRFWSRSTYKRIWAAVRNEIMLKTLSRYVIIDDMNDVGDFEQ